MEYPKIHSLWKRQFTEKDPLTGEIRFLDKGKSGNPFIVGEYSQPEFGNIKVWRVDEKLDGMNVRICYNTKGIRKPLEFKGRTDAAQMPPSLQRALEAMFTVEKLEAAFKDKIPASAILFGEGIGPKIQSGGYYSEEPTFVLFDVWVDGWWLARDSVNEIASALDLSVAPEIGVMSEEYILDHVIAHPLSMYAKVKSHIIEGVVCRSEPLMLYRNGKPIMWKLKCKDFE